MFEYIYTNTAVIQSTYIKPKKGIRNTTKMKTKSITTKQNSNSIIIPACGQNIFFKVRMETSADQCLVLSRNGGDAKPHEET